MALARSRRSGHTVDYWPSFVDALSTLLLAIIFLLSVFVLAQFLLSREITGKDAVLNRLNSQINELTQLLALEKSNNQDLQDSLSGLRASLSAADAEKSRLQQLLDQGTGADQVAQTRIGSLSDQLDSQRQISQNALSQVELLNQQIAALRKQIGALEDALDVSEQRDSESNAKIADLGRRLNVALAQRVQELNRYRSDFFGRLREILADRQNIRIVGDRFVFQSEVLFPSGSDVINDPGQEEMKKLADAIIELTREIPPEINWVLRVDGHTDDVPVSGNGRFADNWDLSAARAIVGGEVPDRQRRAAGPAGGRRLRRIPAARSGRNAGGARQEPPHRVEADGEVRLTRRASPSGPECRASPRHDRWSAPARPAGSPAPCRSGRRARCHGGGWRGPGRRQGTRHPRRVAGRRVEDFRSRRGLPGRSLRHPPSSWQSPGC